jgi:hypothetical protein
MFWNVYKMILFVVGENKNGTHIKRIDGENILMVNTSKIKFSR